MNDETKCHTPFCRKDCALVHHDLIKALCIERNRKETSTRFSSKSHVLLRQCVQLYEQNGWDRNSAIPDPSVDLRHPLLYLTCAFGKHRVLETLVKLDFDPSVTTKDGANGLHGLVDHFYRVGNMKQCGGFMAIDKRLEVFENVVSTLCLRDPNVFSVKEKTNGRTPLHIAAESVLNTSRHARVDGRCDPMKRTRYFQRCLEVMLGHLLELKCNSVLTHAQVLETVAAQDHEGNTILHVLAMSRTLPGWESIQFVLKNFADIDFPLINNKESKTAYEILSSFNAFLAKKLFYPNDAARDGNVTENVRDTSPTPSSSLPQNLEASVCAVLPRSAIFTKDNHSTADIAVEAVWSQAGQVDVSPSKSTQQGSSIKSLESVVLALHSTAKCTPTSQTTSTGSPGSSTHCNGLPVPSSDAVVFSGKSKDSARLESTSEGRGLNSSSYIQSSSVPVSEAGLITQRTDVPDFSPGGFSNEDPYPVFLPNFPAAKSDTECSEPSPPEVTKKEGEITFSPCCVSPLSQSNLEVEAATGASPSPDSWMPGREQEEPTASSAACFTSHLVTNGHPSPHEDLDSTTSNETEKDYAMDEVAEEEQAVQENTTASSSGNSAFFDFLLNQGSEFNPTMKFQIVELIKGEFGKKMTAFNTEIYHTETEKRNLEEEIRNSRLALQQKEEEKHRLFAEIEQLEKNIVQATERHKTLSQQCVKLREESETVKRKISSCEEVEKELFGSPAKMKKLVER